MEELEIKLEKENNDEENIYLLKEEPFILIGENGNWFINGNDTGKPSRGEKGKDGKDGVDGSDGYTPIKGTDYWTETDKNEIKLYCDSLITGTLEGGY